MAPVTLDEAEKLYDKEIARLNTELSGKRQELNKTQTLIAKASSELEELNQKVALKKEEEKASTARLDKIESDIKTSQARSVKALEDKEKSVNLTIGKAEDRIKEQKAAEKAAHEARQHTAGIAKDLEQTLLKLKAQVGGTVDHVVEEIQGYK